MKTVYPRAVWLAIMLATGCGPTKPAAEPFAAEQTPITIDTETAESLDRVGQEFMAAGRPFDALRTLERIVASHPENVKARADLAGLAASLGLEFRAAEHLQFLVQRQQAGINELIMLTDLTRPQTDAAICNYAIQHHPGDLRPQYALARAPAYRGDWLEARRLLEPVCAQHPEFLEACGYYGRSLVELGDEAAIAAWSKTLPTGIESQPQYWIAAGVWAEKQSNIAAAASAYWHAAELNPSDGEALTRLGSCLAETGHGDASKLASSRAGLITAMRDDVESLFSGRNHSQRAAVQIALSMKRLGRVWEAATWARIAVVMTQDPDASAADVFRDIRAEMTGKSPWQSADALVTDAIDVSKFPNIDWSLSGSSDLRIAESAASSIRFADESSARGLDHVCKIDKPVGEEASLWIYQSGAGGAAVIDYDLDGWPDFYLTACDGKPKQQDSSPNRLHRSLAGQYIDVTGNATVDDRGFAQGVAAGDFNSDGFPDLLVGNFGENRLFENNGDGTFTDASRRVGLAGDDWTTSVAIADLDGDAIADLVAVNYIDGDDVVTQPCFPDGIPTHRSCGPLGYPAAADDVWRGRGDGTFVNAASPWIDDVQPGRGLGLIIGQLDNQPGMDLYVANDMTANQFWSAQPHNAAAPGIETVHFVEQAAVRGLAFNERSLSQASMGIAADDVDGDGDLDFYVTHFTDDYNTLYQQISPGIWADRTTVAGMVAPTRSMLAYGTQWIDADNDGQLELVIANGNVDDFTHNGHAYRMPMQVFRHQADGHFDAVTASTLGPYFESARLGRALVSVDANRDRRVDLLVTHLFDPVSLLINTTPSTETSGNEFTLRLVGTKSHRDAIGAVVTIHVGDKSQTRQLLAGNGYQCSSERALRFGIGPTTRIDRIEIMWPSGSSATAHNLDTLGEHLWVEGTDAPTVHGVDAR